MDQNQEHLKNLSEIRSLMERSSSFLSLSGLSGVCTGILGIITFLISYLRLFPYYDKFGTRYNIREMKNEAVIFFLFFSALVLLITFIEVIYFTYRKAKKKGLPLWDGSAKRLLFNLFIPLMTGGLFCLILVYHEIYFLIPASMLIFYGIALFNAGKYTLHDVRYLGISELILGLLAAFFPLTGLWFWGIGFGAMNIVYGIVMYVKYER